MHKTLLFNLLSFFHFLNAYIFRMANQNIYPFQNTSSRQKEGIQFTSELA